jgi:myo-inositol-1(or 4)-monophosphatase
MSSNATPRESGPSEPLAELVRHAEAAARMAGAYALARQSRRSEVVARMHHDVKLQLDLETHEVAVDYLRGVYPQHVISGEEGDFTGIGEATQWVIDPIDGTVNFFHGLPHWCSSVAVFHRGQAVAGAVYAPVADECFTATAESPALRNGEPIRVTNAPSVHECLLLTGAVGRSMTGDAERWRRFRALAAEAGKIRVLGAAALDSCFVACGRGDAFWQYDLNLWDVAAGGLIAAQAGARVERFGTPDPVVGSYIMAGEKLFDALREFTGA